MIQANTKFFKIGRVLKILALLRILRLGRFVRYLHQWEDHLNMNYGFAENMMKSITWTFILIMVGHWNACILYLIPSQAKGVENVSLTFNISIKRVLRLVGSFYGWIWPSRFIDTIVDLPVRHRRRATWSDVFSRTVQVNVTHAFDWLWRLYAEHYRGYVGNGLGSICWLSRLCPVLVTNDFTH